MAAVAAVVPGWARLYMCAFVYGWGEDGWKGGCYRRSSDPREDMY